MKRKRRRNHKSRRQRSRLLQAAASTELRLVGDVSITAADGEDRLATVEIVAYSGGVMNVPGFGRVVVDLAGMELRDTVTLLGDHTNKLDAIAGSGRPSIEGGQLQVSGTIARSPVGEAIVALSRDGVKLEASIGAVPLAEPRRIRQGQSVTANGRQLKGPFLFFAKSRLREVSFVPNGADADTSVAIAASEGVSDMDPQFVEWLQANGFEDPDSLPEQQVTVLQASWQASQLPPDGADPPTPSASDGDLPTADDVVADIRATAAAEQQRINAINQLFTENPHFAELMITANGEDTPLQAHAIADNWTPDAVELYALRNSRPDVPNVHRGHDTAPNLQAMQGLMLLRAGLELDSPVWRTPAAFAAGLPEWTRRPINDDARQQIMEASHRFADWPLFDICREAVQLDGGVVRGSRSEIIQAAFSGSSLTNIFTTSVNAALLTAYQQAGDTTQGWTSTVDVADFKTNERHRMVIGNDLNLLPRGKEAQHLERSDVKETYSIFRYAKQFVVDEQDIIDDRMNALSDTPRQMGAAAARLRPDLVYYIILANAALNADSIALFHASHNNLETTAALSAATLKTAIKDIEVPQENSVNLNLRATHLIVPSELKHLAMQLVNSSTVMRVGDEEAEFGTENTLSSGENITAVSDARLSNGVTDPITGTTASGSGTTWYMASNMAHTIEVAYRTGTGRAPVVRSFTLEGGKWGIGWDVNLDIGAKALDYRGLQKNTA